MRGERPGERCPLDARAKGRRPLDPCQFGLLMGGRRRPPLQQASPRGPGDDRALAGAPRGRRPLGLPMRRSALGALGAEPRRFRFDAAVRVLTRARRAPDPADAVRFRAPPGLIYPSADVIEVRQQGDGLPEVTVGLMGLTGPSGVLPRYYSELVTQALRERSTALRDFLDLLAHRFVAFFARGGIKYRPARAAEVMRQPGVSTRDPVARVLLSLTGYGTAHLTDRLAAGTEPLLHYAGLFALRPVRPSGWARSSLTGSACVWRWWNSQGPGCRFRRISARGCRQTDDGAGWGSRPRPACAPGTRRRASSCASVRST